MREFSLERIKRPFRLIGTVWLSFNHVTCSTTNAHSRGVKRFHSFVVRSNTHLWIRIAHWRTASQFRRFAHHTVRSQRFPFEDFLQIYRWTGEKDDEGKERKILTDDCWSWKRTYVQSLSGYFVVWCCDIWENPSSQHSLSFSNKFSYSIILFVLLGGCLSRWLLFFHSMTIDTRLKDVRFSFFFFFFAFLKV